MAKTIRSRSASHRKLKKVHQKSGGNAPARSCFRCHARMSNCIARGCVPYEFHLSPKSLTGVMATIKNLDKLDRPVRYYSDCIDTWHVQKFIKTLQARTNTKTAIFAIIFYSHFLNMVTLHSVRKAFGRVVDFRKMKAGLITCKKSGYAFHRTKALGGGALKIFGKATGIPKLIAAFRQLYSNTHFNAIVKQLRLPIQTHHHFQAFYAEAEKLRASIPGILGTYRFQNALDVLVAGEWIQSKAICKWPVDPNSGTAVGLRHAYKTKTTGQKQLETMLSELVHRLRCRGYHYDHHGTISMALCWNNRLHTAANRKDVANGLEAAQKVWKTQMLTIEEGGL